MVTASGGTSVFIAGQVAFDAEGRVVGAGDLRVQTEQVFKNLLRALAAAGARIEDLVKTTIFVVDYKPADRDGDRRGARRFYGDTEPPASTLVGVQALVVPELMIEVEAIAVIDDVRHRSGRARGRAPALRRAPDARHRRGHATLARRVRRHARASTSSACRRGRCSATISDAPWCDDARELYQDVLVGLDADLGINNGQPSLHARCLAACDPQPGETALHVGAGTGYYSAILAQLVGERGRVIAYEIEARSRRARAAANLKPWPQVSVRAISGAKPPLPACDVIYVNAGATHPLAGLARCVAHGARLMFPLTPTMARAACCWSPTWPSARYAARAMMRVSFIACIDARDAAASAALRRAFAVGSVDARAVAASRRPPRCERLVCRARLVAVDATTAFLTPACNTRRTGKRAAATMRPWRGPSPRRRGVLLAMTLHAPRTPLATVSRDTPMPGAGEVPLRVRACAVCRTDLHIVDGELPLPRLPLVPGHEIVGTVEALGAGVTALARGRARRRAVAGRQLRPLRLLRHASREPVRRRRCSPATRATAASPPTCWPTRATASRSTGLAMDDASAAPLLCAGLIGWRALQGRRATRRCSASTASAPRRT